MGAAWKTIKVVKEDCTGCRICEIACALSHERVINPEKSSIIIQRHYEDLIYQPHICQQCTDPDCVAACPTMALTQDPRSGTILVDPELCTGCEICVQSCTKEAIHYNSEAGKLYLCNLCKGQPLCVEFCVTKAIQYSS